MGWVIRAAHRSPQSRWAGAGLFGIPVACCLLASVAARSLRRTRWKLQGSIRSIRRTRGWRSFRLPTCSLTISRMLLAVLRWLAAGGRAGLGGDLRGGQEPGFEAHEPRSAIPAFADDCVAGGMAGSAGCDLLELVPVHAMGGGHAHLRQRRSRPGGLRHLGEFFSLWAFLRHGRC